MFFFKIVTQKWLFPKVQCDILQILEYEDIILLNLKVEEI